MPLQIEFSLDYMVRHDDEAKVFVAYVPALRIYAQSKDEKVLAEAVQSGITSFIGLCHDRGILAEAMRERGMRPAKAEDIEQAKRIIAGRKKQYIVVGNLAQESYAVPMTLLAGAERQAMSACHL